MAWEYHMTSSGMMEAVAVCSIDDFFNHRGRLTYEELRALERRADERRLWSFPMKQRDMMPVQVRVQFTRTFRGHRFAIGKRE